MPFIHQNHWNIIPTSSLSSPAVPHHHHHHHHRFPMADAEPVLRARKRRRESRTLAHHFQHLLLGEVFLGEAFHQTTFVVRVRIRTGAISADVWPYARQEPQHFNGARLVYEVCSLLWRCDLRGMRIISCLRLILGGVALQFWGNGAAGRRWFDTFVLIGRCRSGGGANTWGFIRCLGLFLGFIHVRRPAQTM